MRYQKSILLATIFFSSIVLVSCYFFLNNYAYRNDFKPQKYTSHFGVDNAGFYYIDFDNNTKSYYPQFDSSKIKILNENFFIYKNKELYSNYNIEKLLWNDSITQVYESVNFKKIKFLNDNYLYDDKNVYTLYGTGGFYPNFVPLKGGEFDTVNNMLVKDKKMYCFNKDSFDIFNLDDFDVKRKGNISIFKRKLLGDYFLLLGCKRLSLESITSEEIPFFEIKDDSIISQIEYIGDKFLKIKGDIFIDSSYDNPFQEFHSVDKSTFQYLTGAYYKDKNYVYYKSIPLYAVDVNNIRFITGNIVSDGKVSYYKYWQIKYPNLGIEELGKYFFKNGDDVFTYSIFPEESQLSGFDSKSYKVLGNGIIKDSKSVYFFNTKIPLSSDKLKVFSYGYYGDGKKVFYGPEELVGVDISTFKTFELTEGLAKDKNNVYLGYEKFKSIDAETFEVLNYYFGKDKYNLYLLSRNIEKIEKVKDGKSIKVLSNTEVQSDGNNYAVLAGRALYKNGLYISPERID